MMCRERMKRLKEASWCSLVKNTCKDGHSILTDTRLTWCCWLCHSSALPHMMPLTMSQLCPDCSIYSPSLWLRIQNWDGILPFIYLSNLCYQTLITKFSSHTILPSCCFYVHPSSYTPVWFSQQFRVVPHPCLVSKNAFSLRTNSIFSMTCFQAFLGSKSLLPCFSTGPTYSHTSGGHLITSVFGLLDYCHGWYRYGYLTRDPGFC